MRKEPRQARSRQMVERLLDAGADPNRVTCSAQANNATFTLVADIPCDDAKDDKCVQLQKVTTSDGKPLYDTHQI